MIYVALLRGINLGSRRRVAMADLRAWLSELGYSDVRTLLQSGNAVFSSPKRMPAVRAELVEGLASRAGFHIDCVLRTVAELRAVVDADPFGSVATDPSKYLVTFLESPGEQPSVDESSFLPERVFFGTREVYLWVPGGMQKSRIIAAFPARKGEIATMRNWKTVTKLLAMAEGQL